MIGFQKEKKSVNLGDDLRCHLKVIHAAGKMINKRYYGTEQAARNKIKEDKENLKDDTVTLVEDLPQTHVMQGRSWDLFSEVVRKCAEGVKKLY